MNARLRTALLLSQLIWVAPDAQAGRPLGTDDAGTTEAGTCQVESWFALTWSPSDAALLFVESQANSRRAVFGGTLNTAGARWWVVPERLGLDLTAGRENGSGAGTIWTVGFGWYSIGF